MVGIDRTRRANVSTGDQCGDLLRGEYSGGPGLAWFARRFRSVFKSDLTLVRCGHFQDSPCLTTVGLGPSTIKGITDISTPPVKRGSIAGHIRGLINEFVSNYC